MHIKLAETDIEITACFPVMQELRPHLEEHRFLERIHDQQRDGYALAYVQSDSSIVAAAGFRISENLAWGRFMYVDDLVTAAAHRSQGHGARLLDWLKALAVKEGCCALHLDSGSQRKAAHRFYEREGMAVTGLHFAENLAPEG